MLSTQRLITGANLGNRVNWNDGLLVSIADLKSPGPGTSTCTLRVKSNGTVWAIRLNSGDVQLFTWLLQGSNADYEIKVDVTSGAMDAGTTGSWLAMTADNDWTETRSTAGAESCGFTVSIRDKVTTAVLVTVTLNDITCEVS